MVAIVNNRDRRNSNSKNRGSSQSEKLRLRAWLRLEVDRGIIPGLKWVDNEKTELRIPWLHGSKQSWSISDVLIFQRWAEHTGRYSSDCICPKRWKANFRCALKSLSDVVELPCCGQTRGKDAFRVYKFLEQTPSARKQGASAKNSIAQVGHMCKNRRRTISGSVTTCPSPLAHGSEASSITGSDEEEILEEDAFSDDEFSEDASIGDVFHVTCEIDDSTRPTFLHLPAEDMNDVELLLRDFQQNEASFGELSFESAPIDQNYFVSEFSVNTPDDELLPIDFTLVNTVEDDISDRNQTAYNLPDIDNLLMRGLA